MFDFLKDLFSSKVVLNVSLDPSADPPVKISNRNLKAEGKKIRWVRKDNTHKFTFERLNDLNQWYFYKQSIDMDRQKVSCSNRAPDTDEPFRYEIVVLWKGSVYSSTKSGSPPDGKPVIRNK